MYQSFSNAVAVAEISVVIPLCNEEGNVRPLYEELVGVLEGLGRSWEICFVDDGSRDETWERLLAVTAGDPRVKLVRFATNFGQTTALAAGIHATAGRIVVTLDGDLQNDPADIPRLIRVLEQGYDVVHGRRQKRRDAFWTRRLPSSVANWLVRRVTGTEVHDLGCALRAMRRELAERLELIGEMHRFIPVLADALGARSVELDVRHRPRSSGSTKYGLRRTFRVLRDLAVLASLPRGRRTPLSRFSHAAIASGVFGLGLMFCGIVGTAGGVTVRAALLIAAEIAWFFALAMWNLGILAEQLIRTTGWKRILPLYQVVVPGGETFRFAYTTLVSPAVADQPRKPPSVIPFPHNQPLESPIPGATLGSDSIRTGTHA